MMTTYQIFICEQHPKNLIPATLNVSSLLQMTIGTYSYLNTPNGKIFNEPIMNLYEFTSLALCEGLDLSKCDLLRLLFFNT